MPRQTPKGQERWYEGREGRPDHFVPPTVPGGRRGVASVSDVCGGANTNPAPCPKGDDQTDRLRVSGLCPPLTSGSRPGAPREDLHNAETLTRQGCTRRRGYAPCARPSPHAEGTRPGAGRVWVAASAGGLSPGEVAGGSCHLSLHHLALRLSPVLRVVWGGAGRVVAVASLVGGAGRMAGRSPPPGEVDRGVVVVEHVGAAVTVTSDTVAHAWSPPNRSSRSDPSHCRHRPGAGAP